MDATEVNDFHNRLINFCDDKDCVDKVLEFCRRLYDEQKDKTTFLLATIVDLEFQVIFIYIINKTRNVELDLEIGGVVQFFRNKIYFRPEK